jgi:hypothetical protein
MGLITVHAWYADRFQTLCDITGVNKTSGLIRHTTIPVNCPTCLKMLRRHGFDEFKHEIMQKEYSITRRMKATPLLATPVEKLEIIKIGDDEHPVTNEELDKFEQELIKAQNSPEIIPVEEIDMLHKQPEQEDDGQPLDIQPEQEDDGQPVEEFDIPQEQPEEEISDDEPLKEFNIPAEQPEQDDQDLEGLVPDKTGENVETQPVEDIESEKSLSSKPAPKKSAKPKQKPKR